MRFYDVKITDPSQGGKILVPFPFREQGYSDTSYSNIHNGKLTAGGLDVDFQIRNYFYGNHQGAAKTGSNFRIYGVSLGEVGSAWNLRGMNVVIRAGMTRGLPLVKPEQAGIICTGKIWQAIGNWEGIDKTLDLMIADSPVEPKNLQFVWKKGTWLKDAIETTLAILRPKYKINVFINPGLIAIKDETATVESLEAFATMIKNITKHPMYNFPTLTGSPYAGVSIETRPAVRQKISQVGPPATQGQPSVGDSDILVIDYTVKYQDSRLTTDPLLLNIEDFVGQPTWIGPAVIRFKMVLRADIRVGDFVKIPDDPFGYLFAVLKPNVALPESPNRNRLAFRSVFCVIKVTHFGRLRSADASSWVTTFEAVFTNTRGTGLQGPI